MSTSVDSDTGEVSIKNFETHVRENTLHVQVHKFRVGGRSFGPPIITADILFKINNLFARKSVSPGHLFI